MSADIHRRNSQQRNRCICYFCCIDDRFKPEIGPATALPRALILTIHRVQTLGISTLHRMRHTSGNRREEPLPMVIKRKPTAPTARFGTIGDREEELSDLMVPTWFVARITSGLPVLGNNRPKSSVTGSSGQIFPRAGDSFVRNCL